MDRWILAGALAAMAATASAQQQTFTPPGGCEGFVTIQAKGCVVENFFTCEGDPDGYTRRADFEEDGLAYAGLIDGEAQWLESWFPASGVFETLVPDPADPASFSNLLVTGIDTYDFQVQDRSGERFRFVGFDRTAGDPVVIDGVTLTPTDYDIRVVEPDGSVSWQSRGAEFIHEEWRVFIGGVSQSWATGDEPEETDNTPVEFIFPGEDGFFSSAPKYDCGLTEG